MTSKQPDDTWRKELFEHIGGPLVMGVLAVVINFLFQYAWGYRDRVVSALPVWGTCLAVIIAGIVLYVVRGRFRLFYGVNETLLGFFASVRVFVPAKFEYQTRWALYHGARVR